MQEAQQYRMLLIFHKVTAAGDISRFVHHAKTSPAQSAWLHGLKACVGWSSSRKGSPSAGFICLTGLLAVSSCDLFTQPEIDLYWDLRAQCLNCVNSLSCSMQEKGQMRSKD